MATQSHQPRAPRRGSASISRAITESLENRVLFSAGDLDPSFAGGKVTTSFPGTTAASAHTVLVQADGKVVVAGQAGVDFAIARYRNDGTLDPTFSGDGRATTHLVDPHHPTAATITAIAQLPGGKIFAAGQVGPYTLGYAVYKSDGSLDTGFGDGGTMISDFFTELPELSAIAVGPEGEIVTAGSVGDDDGTFDVLTVSGHDYQVGRNDDPEVLGQHDFASDVAIGPDGRIVVIGGSDNFGAFVGRLNPDFTVDVTFGAGGADGDGWVGQLPSGAKRVAVLPTGKILIAGDSGVIRLNGDGSVDKTFGGGDGRAAESKSITDLAVQSDGRVVLLSGGPHFVLSRLNFDGSLDPTFTNGAQTVTDFGGSPDLPEKLAIGADGRIVAVGTKVTPSSTGPTSYRFAVARYLGTTPPNNTITIDGTSGNDSILITQTGTTLTAKVNGVSKSFSTAGKSKLVVRGHAGDDNINVSSNVTLPGFLYGGAGKDKLHGGGGRDEIFGGADTDAVDFSDQTVAMVISLDDLANDAVGGNENVHSDVEIVLGGSANDKLFSNALSNVLVGNAGDDELHGGGGRDVLIGGAGKDNLFADAGDDLLIGSRTTFDADVPSLRTMRLEWANTANAYATRISRLKAGVLGVKIDLAHVPADNATDNLTGGANQDWFVTHATDVVKDKAANEMVTKLA